MNNPVLILVFKLPPNPESTNILASVKMIPIKATRTAAHQETTTIITTEIHPVIMTRTITVKTITTPIITTIIRTTAPTMKRTMTLQSPLFQL